MPRECRNDCHRMTACRRLRSFLRFLSQESTVQRASALTFERRGRKERQRGRINGNNSEYRTRLALETRRECRLPWHCIRARSLSRQFATDTWSTSSRNFPRVHVPLVSPPPLLNLLIAIVIVTLVTSHESLATSRRFSCRRSETELRAVACRAI